MTVDDRVGVSPDEALVTQSSIERSVGPERPEFFPHIDVISSIEVESGCPTPTSEKGRLVFIIILTAFSATATGLQKTRRRYTDIEIHNGLGMTGEVITMTLPPPPSLK